MPVFALRTHSKSRLKETAKADQFLAKAVGLAFLSTAEISKSNAANSVEYLHPTYPGISCRLGFF